MKTLYEKLLSEINEENTQIKDSNSPNLERYIHQPSTSIKPYGNSF